MNPKKSSNNLYGGKKKKSSKKKGSKKKSSKRKGSKKKSSKKKRSQRKSVRKVVRQPVFYNQIDPFYDYLNASRLASSLNNVSNNPTNRPNLDYLGNNYQDRLINTQQDIHTNRIATEASRTRFDGPNPSGIFADSSYGREALYEPNVGADYQQLGINTREERLTAEIAGMDRSRERAEQATRHSAELGAPVYGPAYLQPNFDGHDMFSNPNLDDIFHQNQNFNF